jgi:hypothetical protein
MDAIGRDYEVWSLFSYDYTLNVVPVKRMKYEYERCQGILLSTSQAFDRMSQRPRFSGVASGILPLRFS